MKTKIIAILLIPIITLLSVYGIFNKIINEIEKDKIQKKYKNNIINNIDIMKEEADYYYKSYQEYENNLTQKKLNKILKYKTEKIKSCKNFNDNIDTLTQCIVDTNKKNGVIKNTNKAIKNINNYSEEIKKTDEKKANLIDQAFKEMYYLLMYYPEDFKDFKNYYYSTLKNIDKIYKEIGIEL